MAGHSTCTSSTFSAAPTVRSVQGTPAIHVSVRTCTTTAAALDTRQADVPSVWSTQKRANLSVTRSGGNIN